MKNKKISFFNQRTIEWNEPDSAVRLIDQTMLPERLSFVSCYNTRELVRAIKTMQVRGAPALGIAGAMGVALAVKRANSGSLKKLIDSIAGDVRQLKNARPTAVNLAWGVEQALEHLKKASGKKDYFQELVSFSKKLADLDVENNRKLSRIGQKLFPEKASVLTHCN